MKEYVCNAVAGFQALILLRLNFSIFIFQDFVSRLATSVSRNAF